MAGRRSISPRVGPSTNPISVDDPQVDRAITEVRSSVQRLETQRSRVVITAALVVGTNKIRHGLGRPVLGYTITPTVAAADFAHALDRTNPHPHLEVWIAVVGTEQPAAVIEVF